MEILRREGTYERLIDLGSRLQKVQSDTLSSAGITHQIVGDPTLFDVFFTDANCLDYRSAKHRDPKQNALYNDMLRKSGIFTSPGKIFPSLALSDDDLEQTAFAMNEAAKTLASD
ncbi:MAG: hypothetical protein CMF70_07860 [Magnetovibrio sp.]|nr:hypothetical protein [Magnetovibrio sp.]